MTNFSSILRGFGCVVATLSLKKVLFYEGLYEINKWKSSKSYKYNFTSMTCLQNLHFIFIYSKSNVRSPALICLYFKYETIIC